MARIILGRSRDPIRNAASGSRRRSTRCRYCRAVLLGARLKTRAQFFRARRSVGESLQQRAQVKSRPDGKDREPRTLAQVFENGDGSKTIFSRRERKCRVHQIEQVMRNAFALFDGAAWPCRYQSRDKPASNRRPELRRQISAPAIRPARIFPDAVGPTIATRGIGARSGLTREGPRFRTQDCAPVLGQCSSQELPVPDHQINQTQQCQQEDPRNLCARRLHCAAFKGRLYRKMNRSSIKGPLKADGKGSNGVDARIEETAARSSGSFPELPTMAGSGVWHDAIFHNPELQNDFALFAQLRRFRHHRVPVPLHAGEHARKIVGEVHALGGREHFDDSRRDSPALLRRRHRCLRLHRLARRAGPPNWALDVPPSLSA